ncbi:unnamed protein product (mitochondrion) [Plasmodiophora brassicae]|uniref:Band 7 domain-containing protein n=1 Tax=Plasmodiophora brassicae TaxID=37360 RepID=A0A3P3Y2Q9_PLABS|nr:unnamed protein product [Plasmodiophora brassicae]
MDVQACSRCSRVIFDFLAAVAISRHSDASICTNSVPALDSRSRVSVAQRIPAGICVLHSLPTVVLGSCLSSSASAIARHHPRRPPQSRTTVDYRIRTVGLHGTAGPGTVEHVAVDVVTTLFENGRARTRAAGRATRQPRDVFAGPEGRGQRRGRCRRPLAGGGVGFAVGGFDAGAMVLQAPAVWKPDIRSEKIDGTDDWTVPPAVKLHPYFVEVTTSMADALKELDERMKKNHDYHLISRKGTKPILGRVVSPGQMAVWNRNGRPVIAMRSGNYWNLSIRHNFDRLCSLTQPIDVLGLTAAQAGQSEALVVQDPENRVFIVRNGGFVAYGKYGRFRVIALVDTLKLGDDCAVKEPGTNRIVGWKREVKTTPPDCSSGSVTVATFFNVPANNVVILQRGNKMLLLGAGQHVLTNPNTTFRCFYSLGERQLTFKTLPAYTIEGVPVVLNVNLRYKVVDPLKLTANYDDAFQALANPAQSAVNNVVSRLSYQQFMRANKLDKSVESHAIPWVEAFKKDGLTDLAQQARQYGILVESFDVLDRELEGALGRDLENIAEQVLRNQVQATQIELQNHIATEAQRGKLQMAQVEAEKQKCEADANFYSANKKSDAEYYCIINEAKGKAEGSRMQTEQEVKNTVSLAEARKQEAEMIGVANSKVPAGHAQAVQLAGIEVQKRKALPSTTTYFSGDIAESVAFKDLAVTGRQGVRT